MKNKTLLFIGGTGFLGQSFFDYINEEKLKNINLSKIIIVSRKRKKIKSKIKISYIKNSVANIKKIPITDFIIYAANSKNNKENLRGVNNFKNLINNNHKKTKILFTSSGAVYGPQNKIRKFQENDSVNFKNVRNFKGYKNQYSKTKIIMEREFVKLAKKGFNVSIARLFSFIGRRILINNNFAITNLINQGKSEKTSVIKLNDNKKVFRSYMNSNDLIRWLVKILISSNKECDIFNVGSDEAITISKLAKIISLKFKKKMLRNNYDRHSLIDYYVPSISKAKKKLKLKNKFTLKKSILQLLQS